MDSGGDNSNTLEAFEHLAFCHKAKSRLKNSLDLEKVISGESVTFELDADHDSAAELALDLEDEDEEFFNGLDTSTSITANFFSDKTQQALSKNAATFEALANTEEFISGVFTDMEKSMTSIFRDNLVMKEVVREGTSGGKKVPDNCKVFAHYVAICEGADEPHDSTLLRRAPEIFDMRKADMLPGLFVAIQSMGVGEVAKFIVKSHLAFGDRGCLPRIPPGADILYIVEILQVIDEDLLKSPIYMTAEERAALPFKEIYKSVEQLRTEGNGYYTQGSYHLAIKKYRKGASMLEDYPLAGQNDEKERGGLLHTIYCNLAQCYLKMERWAQACTACKLGLRSAKGKENVKLLYRFAQGKFKLKDYEGSLRLCDDALKLEPTNADVVMLRQRANIELTKQTMASESMFKGIFKGK